MALAMLVAGVASCEQSDVGKACPGLLGDTDPAIGTDRSQTSEYIGQSVEYPCEELICVSSDGRSSYCTKKCRADDAGGCPLGFECRAIQQVEGQAFYDEGMCVWKRCDTDADCGAPEYLECKCSYEIDLGGGSFEFVKLCNFVDSPFAPADTVVVNEDKCENL